MNSMGGGPWTAIRIMLINFFSCTISSFLRLSSWSKTFASAFSWYFVNMLSISVVALSKLDVFLFLTIGVVLGLLSDPPVEDEADAGLNEVVGNEEKGLKGSVELRSLRPWFSTEMEDVVWSAAGVDKSMSSFLSQSNLSSSF